VRAHHLLLAAAGALLIYGLGRYLSAPEPVRSPSVKAEKDRKPAPAFTLRDADGRSVSLADYRGKVVLLDFWATWCDPCRIEVPWFIDLERKDKDRGFAVLAVSMDDGWDDVRSFVKSLGVNYRVLLGDDATADRYGGVEALPTTFLIDRTGRIAAIHIGLTDRRDIEDGVEELLRSPAESVTGVNRLVALRGGANRR
jgi:cytochrome c biogenesis protein CcmG/thiol:disulfide interchange protein DsbE